MSLAPDPSLPLRDAAALGHLAIGIAAMPVALVQPQVAMGLPFYLLVAAPWQAVFNARVGTLQRALLAQPLPPAVILAVQANWREAAPMTGGVTVTLTLSDYGLATASGKTIGAFDDAETLCLVAHGTLTIDRESRERREESMRIDRTSPTPGMPPPLCASVARWSADDARMLRDATREMAELLAAWMLERSTRET